LVVIVAAIGTSYFLSPQKRRAPWFIVRIARALGRLAGNADRPKKRIGVIIRELETGDAGQRTNTIALLRFEPMTPAEFAQVFPFLIQAVKDESAMVRNAAAVVLGDLIGRYGQQESGTGEPEPNGTARVPSLEEQIVSLLDEPSPALRAAAAGYLRTLAAIRQLDAPPPRLVACLDDEDETVRAAAAASLIEYGQGPELFLPVALRRLPSEGPVAFREFTRILWNLRFRPTVLPLLIEGLSSDDALVCVSAATVLNHMGPDGRTARPAVMALLRKELETPHPRSERKDRDTSGVDIIEQTSEALVQLSPDGDPLPGTFEILCEVLKRPNETRQHAAAWSLGFLGRAAAPAVPLLIATFEGAPQTADDLRGTIALALAVICRGTPEADRAVASLAKAWKGAPQRQKTDLAWALRSLSPKSDQLVPELRQWPRDDGLSTIRRGRNPRSFLESARGYTNE